METTVLSLFCCHYYGYMDVDVSTKRQVNTANCTTVNLKYFSRIYAAFQFRSAVKWVGNSILFDRASQMDFYLEMAQQRNTICFVWHSLPLSFRSFVRSSDNSSEDWMSLCASSANVLKALEHRERARESEMRWLKIRPEEKRTAEKNERWWKKGIQKEDYRFESAIYKKLWIAMEKPKKKKTTTTKEQAEEKEEGKTTEKKGDKKRIDE